MPVYLLETRNIMTTHHALVYDKLWFSPNIYVGFILWQKVLYLH